MKLKSLSVATTETQIFRFFFQNRIHFDKMVQKCTLAPQILKYLLKITVKNSNVSLINA